MPNQWDNLFKNEGTWRGSFTNLAPDGQELSTVPSCLTLTRTSDKSARFHIIRYPDGAPPEERDSVFKSINLSSMFCEDGSFTKGSMQWSSFSEFGTEFGLTLPNERLRLVHLFAPGGQLRQHVLIRETREGTSSATRSPLTLEALEGDWQGQAITYFRDWYISEPMASQLTVTRSPSGQLRQQWHMGQDAGQADGTIQGSRLVFERDGLSYQLLCLPNGGSSVCPQTIQPHTPFQCELAWLVTSTTRLRLIRQYQADGSWAHHTWVKEEKVA